jgi:hypothetical protein
MTKEAMDTLSLTMGEGSGATPSSPQELEERLRILDEKVRRDAREIVEVLRLDFPRFVERTVKDRFVGAPDFADTLKDAAVKALKADVADTGRKAVDELVPPLEDWNLWLEAGTPPPPAERKDLHKNAEIHQRIQKIGAVVKALLGRHKFPALKDEDFKDAYKLPSWFIAGRLVVSLVESYWRNLEEYQSVRDALNGLKEREQRAKRAERWDSV